MSLCIRTIPNKFTPLVGRRKPTMRVDRQLPKHTRVSSAFLQEFLSTGSAPTGKSRERTTSFRSMLKALETTENDAVWRTKREEAPDVVDGGGASRLATRFRGRASAQVPPYAVYSSGEKESVGGLETEPNHDSREPFGPGKPSKEQLMRVYQVLRTDLPAFFTARMDYTIYHPMIQFEDNIKGTTTRGIHEYIKQMAILKIVAHVKFAYVMFDVLKITAHPEDGSVKVRWRIRGLSGYRVAMVFWKFKLWNIKEAIDDYDSWYDGFSTFYVDGEKGLIIKHVADKMMPDQDNEISGKEKVGVAAKLTLFLGLLIPRDFFSSDASRLRSKSIQGPTDC